MNKKFKAALAGLAFVAGCEIGIAIQLMKMIHKFTIRESASNTDADYPEEAEIDVTMNEAESEVSDEADKEVDEEAGTAADEDAEMDVNEDADAAADQADEEPAGQSDDEALKETASAAEASE
jgi:hypothetical protein